MTSDKNPETAEPHNEQDLLARLINSAGRRESPPVEHYERVHAAASEALALKLKRQQRRQFAVWASAASVLLVAGLVAVLSTQNLSSLFDGDVKLASLDRLIGSAEWRPGSDDQWQSMSGEKMDFFAGGELRTSSGGNIGLLLENGVSLRMAAETQLRFDGGAMVTLESGKVYLDSGTAGGGFPAASADYSAGPQVTLITAVGTAIDVGTQFEVSYVENIYRLRVREGKVLLDTGAASHQNQSGDQLTIQPSGSVVRSEILADSPEWDWAAGVAPVPDIDGRSLTFLLEWVARETGRKVQYEKPVLKLQASNTLLHGSIRNLTPLQTLDVMLVTTDFRYELLDDGTILIYAKNKL